MFREEPVEDAHGGSDEDQAYPRHTPLFTSRSPAPTRGPLPGVNGSQNRHRLDRHLLWPSVGQMTDSKVLFDAWCSTESIDTSREDAGRLSRREWCDPDGETGI